METIKSEATKIIIGDEVLWTAPFGKDKATITTLDNDVKVVLLRLHRKFPDAFELLVDDVDLSKEDADGAFSVIVDPDVVGISVDLGNGCLLYAGEQVRRELRKLFS